MTTSYEGMNTTLVAGDHYFVICKVEELGNGSRRREAAAVPSPLMFRRSV